MHVSVRPLCSAGITPLPRSYGPAPTPFRAAPPVMFFPPGVGRSRSLPVGPPRLLDRSFHARCPQPPRKARRVLAGCFPTGIRLHPSRQTGHLRLPNEAQSGSLALRLACSPMPSLRQIDFSIPRLLGYMFEQAIYLVNSFQFTRSARLLLAHRPSGSGPGVRTRLFGGKPLGFVVILLFRYGGPGNHVLFR